MSESSCESCGLPVGETGMMDVPVYCIPCIEEMGRLGMGLKRFSKFKAGKASKR